MIVNICSSQREHEAQWHQVAECNQVIFHSTSLPEGPWEFSDDDFIELHCSLKLKKKSFVTYANSQVAFWPEIWICPISWLISLCSMGTYKNQEFCFLDKYCNSGLKSSSETFRARSNFVPVLRCEKSE